MNIYVRPYFVIPVSGVHKDTEDKLTLINKMTGPTDATAIFMEQNDVEFRHVPHK